MTRLLQLCLLLAIALTPAAAQEAPEMGRKAPALVFDAKTGDVLYEEHANALWFPASLTKLMTAYVAFQAVKDGRIGMETPLTISQRALAEPPSKLGMPVGSTIPLKHALEVLIVKSANDLAVAIAEGVGGSVERFVTDMNETAYRLGMVDTHFVNPNGLPAPKQVTTARDLGLLTQALIRDFPQHDAMFAMPSVKVGKRNLRSHNSLLGKFNGADGMKTGYICASGYNLIASATRDDRRLVAVVLGANSGKTREDRAADLLEKGFSGTGVNLLNKRTVAQIPRSYAISRLATHMGPVVCRKRYPASMDAYAVDETLRLQAEERARIAAAKADTEENGPGSTAVMALAAGVPLPKVIARMEAATPVKGKPAPGIPLPVLRPKR